MEDNFSQQVNDVLKTNEEEPEEVEDDPIEAQTILV
jgi:hypothetical protein